MSTTFGPTAIATPANALTLARVAITPALLLSIAGHGASWPALALWIGLAVSDGLDGYLARRHGTTRSGAFLDPLADKFLVLGALGALVVRGTFWWPPVAIIAFRELAISGYRWWMSRRGVSIPARWWAKVKTVVQEVAVGFALLPVAEALTADIATAVLWVAVGLTVFTGAQYVLDGRKAALDSGEGHTRAV